MATRLFIFPKDLLAITGKSERYCQNLIKTAKEAHSLKRRDLLKISTLCEYQGWDETEIRQHIK